MKTFNKKGDAGETSLVHGVRVPKNHPRCEAYGTLDEVVSQLGLARSFCRRVSGDLLLQLQRDLFKAGGELATPPEHYEQVVTRGEVIDHKMVDHLEEMINELESRFEMPRCFVVPGSSSGSAALDVARAMLRRAERRVVDLKLAGEVRNEHLSSYLNRMADLLFVLARFEEDGRWIPL
jgi:cob(I)alamin adenosyltransferase